MLLSIVIPSFNCAQWLRRAVFSAYGFSEVPVEVIVVDDGSTDGTAQLCQELCVEFPSLVVLRKSNGGLSSARNHGERHSRGTHVLFLDADDVLLPQGKEFLLDSDVELLQLGVEEISLGGKTRFHNLEGLTPQTGAEYLKECFRNQSFFPPSWAYIFQRRWYRSRGLAFKEGLLHEDMLFTVQALLECDHLQRWSKPAYQYIRRDGSITADADRAKLRKRIRSLAVVSRELTALAPMYPEVDIGWWNMFVIAYAASIAKSARDVRAKWLVMTMELTYFARNRVWSPFRSRRDIRYRLRQRLREMLSSG